MSTIKYYMNNPCEVLREINKDFSEVSVFPQFDEDMNGGEWCTECMVGNQGTPSTHTCGQYQEALEAIRDSEQQLIVIVENRLLADKPVEFKPLVSARKNIEYLADKTRSADKMLLKIREDTTEAKELFISTAFDANSARNAVFAMRRARDLAKSELDAISSNLDRAKDAVSVGGLSLSMTAGDLKNLIEASIKLERLERWGVDNWEGYGDALPDSDKLESMVDEEIQSLRVTGIS